MSQITIAGVNMSRAAAENVEECGVDVADDVARMRDGLTYDELLDECLDGADDDRAAGWRDYCAALASIVGADDEEPQTYGDAAAAFTVEFGRPPNADDADDGDGYTLWSLVCASRSAGDP